MRLCFRTRIRAIDEVLISFQENCRHATQMDYAKRPTRVLCLEEGENLETSLFRLQKGKRRQGAMAIKLRKCIKYALFIFSRCRDRAPIGLAGAKAPPPLFSKIG